MSIISDSALARQAVIQRLFYPQILRELKQQFRAFIKNADVNGIEYAGRNIDTIVTAEGISEAILRLYKRAAYNEANYQYSSLIGRYAKNSGLTFEFKADGPAAAFAVGFDAIAEQVDSYFRIRLLNRSGLPITETTKKYIRDHLVKEVRNGVAYNEAVRNFREMALDSGPHRDRVISQTRARFIVQTEAVNALSFGGLIGAYMSGVDVDKVWITCNDELVRGTSPRPAKFKHNVLDKTKAPLLGSFYNGEAIKYPADPDASPANRCNCRCSVYYVLRDKPKPRVANRSILNFLTDFGLGFILNINNILQGQEENGD